MGGAIYNGYVQLPSSFIEEAFNQNWVAPLGTNVDAVEDSLADYFKINTLAFCSGTAAIHLALNVLLRYAC